MFIQSTRLMTLFTTFFVFPKISSDKQTIFNGRDVKIDIKIGSDWPRMGQIWEFLRSVSVHFDQLGQSCPKWSKSCTS